MIPLTSRILCCMLLHNVGTGSLGEETKGLCAWNTDSGLFDFGERTWRLWFFCVCSRVTGQMLTDPHTVSHQGKANSNQGLASHCEADGVRETSSVGKDAAK